jgi:thioredoxin 1
MSRPTLTVTEAAEQIVADAFVLDVREHDEYAAAHIDGAQLIPLGTLANRLDEVPRDQPVIVVCRSGNRSGSATDLLIEHGVDAWNMAGGMTAWTAADLPTARD